MSFNMSALEENSTSFFDVIDVVMTDATNNLFGSVFLIALYIVLFIALKRYDTRTALLTSSFITSVVAMVFKFAFGWISWSIMIIPVFILVASLIIYLWSE